MNDGRIRNHIAKYVRFSRVAHLAVCFGVVLALSAGAQAAKPESIPDEKIMHAIETELLLDEGVSAHLIDVSVSDGIATLSGTSDNILAQDRAADIAESIKGVRAVVDRMKTSPVERADDQIRENILQALAIDPATSAMKIDVAVVEGTVRLSGTVGSWAEKDLASSVAKGVKGVTGVTNDITIAYPSRRKDSEIKADVLRQLQHDVRVDDELISIKVKNGAVTLQGTIGSATEKKIAIQNARVHGVASVDAGKLAVEWWARDSLQRKKQPEVSENEITEAIYDAFRYDPRVSATRPTVNVVADVVTLSGEVTSLGAKYAAENTARNTVGVSMVHNLLRVRPQTMVPDSVIEQSIIKALARDPYLEMRELDVSVLNGKAYLYGRVNSRFEKRQADDVVSRLEHVIDIENNIEVLDDWEHTADQVIRRQIESKLYWSPQVNDQEVNVLVENGIVTLKGSVDSWTERKKAVQEAWDGGARYVKNDLEIVN